MGFFPWYARLNDIHFSFKEFVFLLILKKRQINILENQKSQVIHSKLKKKKKIDLSRSAASIFFENKTTQSIILSRWGSSILSMGAGNSNWYHFSCSLVLELFLSSFIRVTYGRHSWLTLVLSEPEATQVLGVFYLGYFFRAKPLNNLIRASLRSIKQPSWPSSGHKICIRFN